MFHIAEQCAKAGTALLEAQLAQLQAVTHAFFDGGMHYAERNVDAFRYTLASGTVAAKQLITIPRGDAQ